MSDINVVDEAECRACGFDYMRVAVVADVQLCWSCLRAAMEAIRHAEEDKGKGPGGS